MTQDTNTASGAADRRAFYLDAMKDKKNHEALAFELAFLREKLDAPTAEVSAVESAPAQPVVPVAWPETCDGKEQEAWEAWAKSQRYDMARYPLYYLFLNEQTVAARQGWKAGLCYAVEQMKGAAPAQPVAEPDAALTYKQVLGSKNCMQCCVSYMLGLPLESVPDFAADGGWELFSDFAESQGYAAVMLPGDHEFEADYLASGTTARGTSHMVVMNDGKLVHDPHPSNVGLVDVQCVWLLTKRATPRTVQEKFAQVNGLKVQGGSYE